jgi:hypothetical protein
MAPVHLIEASKGWLDPFLWLATHPFDRHLRDHCYSLAMASEGLASYRQGELPRCPVTLP